MGRYHSICFDFMEDIKKVIAHEIAWHKLHKEEPFAAKEYEIGSMDAYKAILDLLECDYPDELYEKFPFLVEGDEYE